MGSGPVSTFCVAFFGRNRTRIAFFAYSECPTEAVKEIHLFEKYGAYPVGGDAI